MIKNNLVAIYILLYIHHIYIYMYQYTLYTYTPYTSVIYVNWW